MALKTQKNNTSVLSFISRIENKTRKRDANTLLELINGVIGLKPSMWGTSIISYGALCK